MEISFPVLCGYIILGAITLFAASIAVGAAGLIIRSAFGKGPKND